MAARLTGKYCAGFAPLPIARMSFFQVLAIVLGFRLLRYAGAEDPHESFTVDARVPQSMTITGKGQATKVMRHMRTEIPEPTEDSQEPTEPPMVMAFHVWKLGRLATMQPQDIVSSKKQSLTENKLDVLPAVRMGSSADSLSGQKYERRLFESEDEERQFEEWLKSFNSQTGASQQTDDNSQVSQASLRTPMENSTYSKIENSYCTGTYMVEKKKYSAAQCQALCDSIVSCKFAVMQCDLHPESENHGTCGIAQACSFGGSGCGSAVFQKPGALQPAALSQPATAMNAQTSKAAATTAPAGVSVGSGALPIRAPPMPSWSPSGSSMIPRVIHHVYKYDLTKGRWPNKIWETSFFGWKKYFPEPWFQHIFWPDANASQFFRKYCPAHYKVYKEACKGGRCSDCKGAPCREIVRSDLSRYCILSKLGGTYADLDYEPRINFYGDLQPDMVNLIQSPYKSETFQNSLMASQAGHPYWEKVLDQAARTMKTGKKTDILRISGPELLESVHDTHDPKVVHSLPCNQFQRATHFAGGELQAANQKHCRVLRVDDLQDKDLKGIHWGTVSWRSGSLEALQLFQAFHGQEPIANLPKQIQRMDHVHQLQYVLDTLSNTPGMPIL